MGKAPHIPVLIAPLIARAAPIAGLWLDGTFGAGGYARALLDAGAGRVIGVDQDPLAFRMAADWAETYGDRLQLVEGRFGDLDALAGQALDGVVLDLGVSSMQIDDPARGFSFQKDGPLDMRMAQSGPTAATLVAEASEGELADILYQYGEERASRRIARAIVAARAVAPIVTTGQLAEIVARCLPRPKPGQTHPATRSFQALRIAVNDEFGQLIAGLEAAERALKPGGFLGVVTFHSLEDRVVKRFLQARSGQGGGSRHLPEALPDPARFTDLSKGIAADAEELAGNPRSRSARLRTARRTDEPAGPVDRSKLGLPKISIGGTR